MYDNIQFDSIRFASAGNEMLVIANCVLNKLNPFSLTLLLTDEAKWHIKKINAKQNIYEIISRNEYRQALENKVAKFLLPTNGWRGEIASETANNMSFNQQLVPPEEAKNLVFSFRYGMLDLPATNWVDLWALIKDRVEGDPFFFIQGFLKDEIRLAINQLILLFPGKWVLARYRNACRLKSPSMANHLPQDSDDWFPAYHLARTALGAICVDPGWNYLIEIGLSLNELDSFNKLAKLKRQITRSPGTQHHLCLAAELYRKGHLISLEPQTGSGASTNDLLVKVGGREYEIEVKEFSSKQPEERLIAELQKKDQKLPALPKRPVIFHAVLSEKGGHDKAVEDRFFGAVQKLRDCIPPKISALVAGRRFVDSFGGRVKRDTKCQILNPQALVTSRVDDLSTLFAQNYDTIKYPIFGIGSFLECSITHESSELV